MDHQHDGFVTSPACSVFLFIDSLLCQRNHHLWFTESIEETGVVTFTTSSHAWSFGLSGVLWVCFLFFGHYCLDCAFCRGVSLIGSRYHHILLLDCLGLSVSYSACVWAVCWCDVFLLQEEFCYPVECLALTVEEVMHIRQVLVKAELEKFQQYKDIYTALKKGKVDTKWKLFDFRGIIIIFLNLHLNAADSMYRLHLTSCFPP